MRSPQVSSQGPPYLKQRRDSTRIIFEILFLSSSGASKTRIIRKLGLNFPLAMKYIRFLTERGHLQLTLSDRVFKYVLTDSGELLLSYLAEVEKELRKPTP